MLDYQTVQTLRREINKLIEEKKTHIVYSVDSVEKLQYSRGQLSSLEELLQVMKDLLKKEEIEDDNDPG